MKSVSVLVAGFAAAAAAFPTWDLGFSLPSKQETKMTVVEQLDAPPKGWLRNGNAAVDKENSLVKLRLRLQSQDMDKFHDMAMKIATPGHELYRYHVDQQTINNIIAPKRESGDLVMQWLEKEGLSDQAYYSSHSDSVIVEASISQIEDLLNAEYQPYTREDSDETVVRTLEYSLPEHLKSHVKMVQPTTFFGLKALRSNIKHVEDYDESEVTDVSHAKGVTGCGALKVTPECLENLYNFGSANASLDAGLMGIAGFLEQWPRKSDLSTFLSSYAVFDNDDLSYTCELINGGTCPSVGTIGVEANLDVQYARAITASIPNTFYSVGGSPPIVGTGENTNEPYLEFLDYLLNQTDADLPNTISISYGDAEDTVPLDYADEVCDLFSQLGARGVSILVASGDSGVGSTCSNSTFETAFPASCPWVTTVGGTTGQGPEGAWADSGGGFSEVFGRPSYQDDAIKSWLANDSTHASVSSYFNSSGRGYPDVAAQSTYFIIVDGGSSERVDGTSCATPTFASVIQLVNSELVAAGEAPLGFLNPWLYTTALSGGGLTDITTGSNTGCSGALAGDGFKAVAGWDPATGLGTPDYATLLSLAKSG